MVEKVRPRRFAKVSYLRVFARSTARWVEVDDNGNANAARGQNLQKANGAADSELANTSKVATIQTTKMACPFGSTKRDIV
jgi:hypothetical protein